MLIDASAAIAGMRKGIQALWRDERGVTSIEYGLLGALIVVVCIGAFRATGGSLSAVYVQWSAAVLAAR